MDCQYFVMWPIPQISYLPIWLLPHEGMKPCRKYMWRMLLSLWIRVLWIIILVAGFLISYLLPNDCFLGSLKKKKFIKKKQVCVPGSIYSWLIGLGSLQVSQPERFPWGLAQWSQPRGLRHFPLKVLAPRYRFLISSETAEALISP